MSVVIAAAGRSGALDAVTHAWVEDATAHASFAGPDGSSTKHGDGWALGHCLLRTGHGESSIGPITLDGHVWLSADVRLDDRATLIAALTGRGARPPATADDAELVLGGYATWGERVVDHLKGDFTCSSALRPEPIRDARADLALPTRLRSLDHRDRARGAVRGQLRVSSGPAASPSRPRSHGANPRR